VEEIALDASRDWDVIIPIRRFPLSNYSEPVTVHGEIRSSLGPEIPDGSTLSVYLYSATGGACSYPDLTYNGEYSFSTSLACADCLLLALVKPQVGARFVVMARALDLSGVMPVQQDLAEPDGGYVTVSVTPDQAGNQAQCLFITDYGPVPAYFKGKGPTLTWSFSSGGAEPIPVFNPYAWSRAVWIQTEEDPEFAGLPQHIKEFLSASSAGDFSSPTVLPAIDRSLRPTAGADPASLEYTNGTLSLEAVAGARDYAFTLRADSPDGDVLGMIWTGNASTQLPGWMLKILSGRTVHLRFEALDCGDSLFDPRFLWGALPLSQMALGRVRGEDSQPYEKVITVPAGGSVEIGLE
jgi:hypothetical protein